MGRKTEDSGFTEISVQAYERIDINKYRKAMMECEHIIVLPEHQKRRNCGMEYTIGH